MAWHYNSITPGELQALREAARRAWADDTRYPNWSSPRRHGGGQCFVTAHWLAQRLGGHVGVRRGHYVWLSSDRKFAIDLTGHHTGKILYGENPGFEHIAWSGNDRAQKFAHRADRIFENLDLLLKEANDSLTGDAYPAEAPQRFNDRDQEEFLDQPLHDEPDYEPPSGDYRFVYAGGQLEVSPFHDHDELLQHTGVEPDYPGPVATGWITVNMGKATFDVNTNINIGGLVRVLKDYCKQVGWKWGGITNGEGEPISDEFKPVKSKLLRWRYAQDHLWLTSGPRAELALKSGHASGASEGVVLVRGQRAEVAPVTAEAISPLADWARDEGLTLYALNDNVLKRIEDLELDNLGTPTPNQADRPFFPSGTDEREPSGVYRCPSCNLLFPNWHEYSQHRRDEEPLGDEPIDDGQFPDTDMDATFPTHFTEQQPQVQAVSSWREAARVAGFKGDPEDRYYVAYRRGCPVGYLQLHNGKILDTVGEARLHLIAKVVRHADKQPKDLLEGPLPFIYDVQEDGIFVGQSGQRTADIPGRFTPGGIVEGHYEPGGKVYIRSMTNMPYSVRHLIELFYYQHPELEVTNVYLRDDDGGQTKLADAGVGPYIAAQVASDPAASAANQALMAAGGQVYAVGGAVRDALMGKPPKDIDLMVRGIEPDKVREALEALPGRVDLTGKDFGVFRYRHKGDDVEIALPRRERSVGSGHQDFEVQADHTMLPEDDLYRRDFTANAVAVDLSNGQLIDPYNGAQDIRDGVLRSVNNASLGEDPLRIVRALVAHSRHSLDPDDSTREQMQANAGSLNHLPPERIQAELDKLMSSADPASGIRLARDTGVLRRILPEVDSAMGYDQNNPHHELELGDHLVNVLDRSAQISKDPDVRMAALLHDIGKPNSAWVDPQTGSNHFYYNHSTGQGADHEQLGADMARDRLNALRYPRDRAQRVESLVRSHMWSPFTTPKGARRFLNRYGDNADDLMKIRWADQGGKSEYPGNQPDMNLDTQRNLIDQVRSQDQPVDKSQLAIDGHDLIALGVVPGPQMGVILNALTQAVIENPDLNSKDALEEIARGYL